MPDDRRPRIINVTRKPTKCPNCGEKVVDIVYGTGDMTEIEFALQYRKEAIMGGDNIPRRPPIWCCSCGCKRFRKVNPEGTDVAVKVKMLKDTRKAPASVINWSSSMVDRALKNNQIDSIHKYTLDITTDFDEQETLVITAVSQTDAELLARDLVRNGAVGLKGRRCIKVEVISEHPQYKCYHDNAQ